MDFTCEKCGHHKLQEVMSDCIVCQEVDDIDDNGDVIYGGEQVTHYGIVDRYECAKCSTAITVDGGLICNPDTLKKHLQQKGG